MFPFIDGAGGIIDGMIRAASANIAMVNDRTAIVPGHGAVGDRTQMNEFRDMLVNVRNAVAALKKRGLTLQQVIAARPTARYDAKFAHGIISRRSSRPSFIAASDFGGHSGAR